MPPLEESALKTFSWTMLEVEPEVASKIQARARERGVSVDVYLRELIEKETQPERSSLDRVRMLREWASGHSTKTPLLFNNGISRESIYGDRG